MAAWRCVGPTEGVIMDMAACEGVGSMEPQGDTADADVREPGS